MPWIASIRYGKGRLKSVVNMRVGDALDQWYMVLKGVLWTAVKHNGREYY
ncbi:hypothetical protein TREPR_1991 [Treponema primitia ZAS-2]|uniref:Uncharacterized protein n=1 Tax=Treponema primitia (strain ATCC BAA-887 / DSM 12427 / ZAS-2) TaxID=545694 RepID=F5YKE4_TREPZ|nr:hypothetical protein TREPR_1991 [Treponema primitia ZAS-2]